MESQAGPGLISILLILILAIVDPMLTAAPIGAGVGTLINPVCVFVVAITAIAADGWRSALLGALLAAILGNTIGVHPLGDEPAGWRITAGVGTFLVGSIIVAIFGGLKALFRRRPISK